MQWQITPESILLIICSAIVTTVAIALWWKRNTPGAKNLLVMMVASTIWCLASAFEYAVVSPEMRILASKLQYIGIYTLIPTYVMFGLNLSHIRRRINKGFVLLLWTFSTIIIFLAFTNEFHGLIWANITPIPGSHGLVYEHGLGFWFAVMYSYICLITGSGLVIYAARSRLAANNVQTSVIFTAVVIPWIANVLYITGLFPVPGIDPTPYAFAISGILFAVSIYRFHIFDITPIARDKVIDTMSDLLIIIDVQSQIIDLNPAVEKMLNVKRHNVIGHPATKLLSYWPHLAHLFSGKFEESTIIKSIQDQNGLWYSLRISPIQGRQEHMSGWMILLSDITDRKKQEDEVKRLAHIIEEASEAIVQTDVDGNIVYVNPFFEEITGYTLDEAVGGNPRILKSNKQDEAFYKNLWDTITSGHTWRGNFVNKRKDGSLYHEAATIFPIKNSNGKITNYAAVKRDISEQVIVEQAILESERRYRLLADNVTDVIWTMNLEGRFTYISPSVEALRGYTPEEALQQSIEEALTPESLQMVLPNIQNIFTIIRSGEKLEEIPITELEQPCKDGGTVWVEAITNIMYDDDGNAIGILGLTRNITERKRAQEEISAYSRFQNLLNEITLTAIRQSDFQEMLQLLADRVGELLYADGCYITLWDEKSRRVFPVAAYGPLRDSYQSITLPEPDEPTLTASVLEIEKPLAVTDVFNSPYISPKIAAQFPAKSQLALPLIANEQKLGAALIAFNKPHEFTANEIRLGEQAANQIALAVLKAKLLAEAEHLAIHDPLTGLLNRRHFMEIARQEFSRARRYHYPLSIIMFDIDYFKQVNDIYGHIVGDHVIQMVAQNCLSGTRASDIIGRYGGEEFIILLPETPLRNPQESEIDTGSLAIDELPAKSVATRLRRSIELSSHQIDEDTQVKVTISLGIAEINEDCLDLERLIDWADQALLEAKQRGRNQIIIWDPK